MRDTEAALAVVRRQMAELNLSPPKLAAAADVSPNTVRAFLAGRSWPVMATMGRIEKALDWPAGRIEDIAHGTYPGAPPEAGAAPSGNGVVAAGAPSGASEGQAEPVEVVFGGMRVVIHPRKGATPEQVRAQTREIVDAVMERLERLRQREGS